MAAETPRPMSHGQCRARSRPSPGAANRGRNAVMRLMVQNTTLAVVSRARQHPHRDRAQRVGDGSDQRGEGAPGDQNPAALGRSMMMTPARPSEDGDPGARICMRSPSSGTESAATMSGADRNTA